MSESTKSINRLISKEIIFETKSGSLKLDVDDAGRFKIGAYEAPGTSNTLIIDPINNSIQTSKVKFSDGSSFDTATTLDQSLNTLQLKANKIFFKYNGDGVAIPSQQIEIKVVKGLLTTGTPTLSIVPLSANISLNQTAADTYILTVDEFDKAQADSIQINATLTNLKGTLTDSLVIIKAQDGRDSLNGGLSNPFVALQADSDGNVTGLPSLLAAAGGTFTIFKGSEDLTGNSSRILYSIESLTEGFLDSSGNPTVFINNDGIYTFSNFDTTEIIGEVIFLATDLITNQTFKAKFTVAVVKEGKKGDTGSSGINARTVKLTANDSQIAYLSNDSLSAPTSIEIVATEQNHVGTVNYEFIVFEGLSTNGTTLYNGTSNTITLTNTSKTYGVTQYTFINPTKTAYGKSKTLKVRTRENSTNGTVKSEDTITIIATKDGSDALEVVFENSNHSFVADVNGNVSSYSGGGSIVEAYIGNEQLTPIASGTPANGQFVVAVNTSTNITSGAITANTSTKRITIADPSGMSAASDTASITYTITAKSSTGVTKSQIMKASFSKSKTGATGATGANGTNGINGTNGTNGADGADGIDLALIYDFSQLQNGLIYGWNASTATPRSISEPASRTLSTSDATSVNSSEAIYGGRLANFVMSDTSKVLYTADLISVSQDDDIYELSYRFKISTVNTRVTVGLYFYDQDGYITAIQYSPTITTSTTLPSPNNFNIGTHLLQFTNSTTVGSVIGVKTVLSRTVKFIRPYLFLESLSGTSKSVLVDKLFFGIKQTPNRRSGFFHDPITGRTTLGISNADISSNPGTGTTERKYDSTSDFEIVGANIAEPTDIQVTRGGPGHVSNNSVHIKSGHDMSAIRFGGWDGTFAGTVGQSNPNYTSRASIRATYNRTGSDDGAWGAIGGASIDFYTAPSRDSVGASNVAPNLELLRARVTDQGQFLVGYTDATNQVGSAFSVANGQGGTYTFNVTNNLPKLAVNGNLYGKSMVFNNTNANNLILGTTYIQDLEPYQNTGCNIGSYVPFTSVSSKSINVINSNGGSGVVINPTSLAIQSSITLSTTNANLFVPLIIKGTGGSTPGTIGNALRIEKFNDVSSYWDIFVHNGDGAAGGLDGGDLAFFYAGSGVAFIRYDIGLSSLNFTGQHKNIPKDNEDYKNKIGLIIVSSGEYASMNSNSITINEALPKVYLSTKRNQKNVFGVISDCEDPNSEIRTYEQGRFVSVYDKSSDDNRLIINSLGEGGIWICNINGNLENGDYITTCEIPGYGMKQDDDLLHNYTVAKITCDCDFNLESPIYICEEFQFEGKTYRKAFVGCTYHCG